MSPHFRGNAVKYKRNFKLIFLQLYCSTNTNTAAVCLLCVLTLQTVKIAYVYVNYISC